MMLERQSGRESHKFQLIGMFPTTQNVPGHQLANSQNRGQVPDRRLANGRKNELVLSWSQAMSRPFVCLRKIERIREKACKVQTEDLQRKIGIREGECYECDRRHTLQA